MHKYYLNVISKLVTGLLIKDNAYKQTTDNLFINISFTTIANC